MLTLALAVAALTTTPTQGELLRVAGDVVRVRAAPAEGAAVLARLRNGTPVRFLEERGGWRKIDADPSGAPFVGWVQAPLVDVERVRDEILAQRADVADLTARVLWLERLVARRGDRATLAKLRASYEAAGDVAKARLTSARVEGTAPFVIGACVADRLQVLAAIQAGRVRPLAGRVTDETDVEAAKKTKLARELDALAASMTGTAELWFTGESPAAPLFRRPQVVFSSSAAGTTVVLDAGPCPAWEGEPGPAPTGLVATAPLPAATVEPALDVALAKELLAGTRASALSAVRVDGAFIDAVGSFGRRLLAEDGARIDADRHLPAFRGSWWTPAAGLRLLVVSERADELPGSGWPTHVAMGEGAFHIIVVDHDLRVTTTRVQVYESGC